MGRKLRGGIAITFLLLIILGAEPCIAQVPADNIIDQVALEFQTSAANWGPLLQGYARRLFWFLVGISFTAQALRLVFKGGDLGDFLEFIVGRILTIGFFALLLENSSAWAQAIVASMRQAGAEASLQGGGLGGISPSNIFDSGLKLAGVVVSEASFWTPGDSLALLLSSLLLVVVFALIAAEMLFLIVQMHVVINAGVILTGFGGSHWTQSIAINFLRTALATGVQLFLMQLVVGLGQSFILRWVAAFERNNSQVLTMVGIAIVFLVLATKIPAMASSLVRGDLMPGGLTAGGVATGFLAGAGAGVGVGATAAHLGVTQVTGASALAYEVAKAAPLEGKAFGKSGGGSIGGSSGQNAASISKPPSPSAQSSTDNKQSQSIPTWFKAAPLPKAVRQELSDWASGRISPRGTSMGRIAGHMRDARKHQEAATQNQISPSQQPKRGTQ